MGKEIERKFLVRGESWPKPEKGKKIIQGYLLREPEKTVRIRIMEQSAFITIKGKTTGASRDEFEYEIPVDEAREMLNKFCPKPHITKTRYDIFYRGRTWEIDIFNGENRGLILAEVELPAENNEVELPPWVGKEVTGDPRFYNANLSVYPFKEWKTGAQ